MDSEIIVIPVLAILTILLFVIVLVSWRSYSKNKRVLWTTLLTCQILGVLYLFSLNWGAFPWGQSSAFQTADNFLFAMNQGNYPGAVDMMRPCVMEYVGVEALGYEDQTKPINWQLTEYEVRNGGSVSIIGSAVFVTGIEHRIEISMKWNGFKWEVDGVIFGEPYKEPVIQFHWGC